MRYLIILGILLSFGNLAGAPKKRVIEINFDDELVKGNIKKPELFYLLQRKQFNFKRMIDLRDDFIPEMKSTGKRVQVGGEE